MSARSQDRPRFLFATDLSPETVPHLRHAMRLAQQFDAKVTLFHAVLPRAMVVDATTTPVRVQFDDVALSRETLQRLASTLATWRPVDVEVTEASDARRATLAAAERIGATMIVLASHGRSGLERAVLGSTAEQILRRARVPVLLLTDRMVLHADDAPQQGPIVVATDLSPIAIAAHRPAAELAHRLGRPMTWLSVLPLREPPAYGGGAAAAMPPSDPQLRCREHRALLRHHAVETGCDQPVEVLALIDDDVPGAIVRAARELDASLLVLATHGRRGVARLLVGSVAEQVVRHATVPVACMPRPAD